MSRLQSQAQAARGLSGRQVLAAMISFFAVIIVADSIMIYKAVSTFGGLENTNAYRDGLAYNARIVRADRQSALGWTDTVEILAEPARLRVSLASETGIPPAPARIEAVLGRPATNRSDSPLKLAQVAPGVFEAPIAADLAPGTWIATLRAFETDAASEPVFQARRRLWRAP
ncbi:FixH family protein [Hyphomicrobium sp. CS1GBMeth3]|uniref:FixH family protein n=1 Tax=Hyphomicrobium sp. CS1GBMeth3 TaxID=1892845 RepID=UPI0009FB3C63|nr:FixH family protein [Hyphomicrobium sp. CS1GBMeth3]